jgi:hypothetical protein
MKRRVSSAAAKAQPKRALVQVGAVSTLRGALTVAGDIRSDVEFQNDVNALLATVGKLTALGPNQAAKAVAPKADDFEVSISDTPEPVVATPTPVPTPRPASVRRARAGFRG